LPALRRIQVLRRAQIVRIVQVIPLCTAYIQWRGEHPKNDPLHPFEGIFLSARRREPSPLLEAL